MVQRPRPDLRGGCAAMRIPTATVQGLLLEENGHRCTEGALYFAESRTSARRLRRGVEGGDPGGDWRVASGRGRWPHSCAAARQPQVSALLARRYLPARRGQSLPPHGRHAPADRGAARRDALLQSPAAWLSVCVICSERLRHERIQGTSLPGGNRALGRTLVLPLRGQLPRPRSDDDRARRRGRPLHDLSLGAAIRSGNGETAALAVASAAVDELAN